MIHNARWKCHACGSDFKDPEPWYAGSKFHHHPDSLVCPMCKSDDIELAEHCLNCDGVFFNSKLTYGICADCIEDYAVEHADEYVCSSPDVWDEFAWYMHKRIGGDSK